MGAALLPLNDARAATPLEIAIVSRTVFYVPLWIAMRKGFLGAEGIAPTVQVYDNAEKINADLRAGTVKIAVSTPESVIIDSYRGGSLRIVAGNAEKLPHFIIAKPSIKTLAQLRGAKIGVLSLQEGTTFLVQEVARAAGLQPSDYTIEAVGGAPTRWKLLKEGAIDVGLQPFPLSYEAEAAGFSNLGAVSRYVPDYQFTSINVDQGWALQNRNLVIGFLRAMQCGQTFADENRAEAAEIAAQELRTTPELARRAIEDTEKLHILSKTLAPSEAGLMAAFKTLQAVGLLDPALKFDIGKIADGSYLAMSK